MSEKGPVECKNAWLDAVSHRFMWVNNEGVTKALQHYCIRVTRSPTLRFVIQTQMFIMNDACIKHASRYPTFLIVTLSTSLLRPFHLLMLFFPWRPSARRVGHLYPDLYTLSCKRCSVIRD